jgi:mannose-1-phosphate guanylyltransferase
MVGREVGVTPMRAATPHGKASPPRERRWGVILAGGDGIRLQKLTGLICGDDRPKQFCPLLDAHTLLEHTVRRTQHSFSMGQILFALTRSHREFYLQELGRFQPQRIVQPANKGTAPPILFSVLSIERMDEDALVAILPSDHYYSDETCFTAALESAFEIAAERPESVVLLGAQPDRPEVEYGWIELGPSVRKGKSELLFVRSFWEKPSLEIAQTLLGQHSAWNTFVMVGHVRAFVEMIAQAIPDVLEAVRRARLWTGSETHIEESAYNQVPSSDFSRRVLSVEIARLLVLRVRNLGWSDLGHPGRVLAVLEESGVKPGWMREWRQAKQTAAVARTHIRSAVA